GTPKSEELATYWSEKLETLRKPIAPVYYSAAHSATPSVPRERMKFFVGYAFSIEAPYGLTVGGVARRLGWYARFKTNFSFDKALGICNNKEVLNVSDKVYYNFTGEKRVNTYLGTVGMVVKCTPWLYTSIGLGYGSREMQWRYVSYNFADDKKNKEEWCKNTQASYDGIAADLDVTLKFDRFFISAGCNTMSFKYVDLNAGLGVFF
ncbi:MAG: hypothetical protein RR382_11160, partial [Tannerellaceae bacterium]